MRQVVDALLLDQKRNQVRTAKKDAALKACVEARDRLAQEPTVLIHKWKVLEELNAAITKAQEALK